MRSSFSIGICLLLVTGAGSITISPAFATGCTHYQGHVDVEGKAGSKRDIGETSVFMPIACSEDVLLFSDTRFRGDNQSNREGNLGIGVRQLKQHGILGGYVYLDRKRSGETDKYHSQTTIGTEWLAGNWEVRANGYIPLTGSKAVGETGSVSDPFLQGSGIFIEERAGNLIREKPLYGADIEAGFNVPETDLWLHGAAYSFKADSTPDVTGGRMRASFHVTDNATLLAEGQYDGERGRQGWLGLRLTMPIGPSPAQKPEGLKARMTINPVRDVDIVTHTKVTSAGGRTGVFEVTNSESGEKQRVIYVDNSHTGVENGTRENPYTSLAAAQAALAPKHCHLQRSHGNALPLCCPTIHGKQNPSRRVPCIALSFLRDRA